MQVSSDDGFRVSQGKGITRQVLHVKGSNVDRDVAAVVCTTNNSTFGGSLPVAPISGPVVYFPAGHPAMLSQATNLTGKIAVMNNTDFADRAYANWAQIEWRDRGDRDQRRSMGPALPPGWRNAGDAGSYPGAVRERVRR